MHTLNLHKILIKSISIFKCYKLIRVENIIFENSRNRKFLDILQKAVSFFLCP